MSVIPLWLILSAGFAGWLITARTLYSRWRGRQVGHRECLEHGSRRYRENRPAKCCYDGTLGSDGEVALLAMVAALAFPLVILAAAVRWQPGKQKRCRLTPAEEAEIEREVGLGS